MRPRLTALALVAAASLALAGCSALPGTGSPGPGPEPAPSLAGPDAAPATGDTLTGDGYSYRVPEDWGAPPGPVPGFDPDSLAADLDDTDGFADNLNVILAPGPAVGADDIERVGVRELEGAGATDVAVEDRLAIAGEESAHLSAMLASNGSTYRIDQFYPSHDGQTYVITFSFSQDLPGDERDEVIGSILASWEWA